jgi:hypothetical protein
MTPFTSSTKEMNVIKATSLALALAVLIGNAASAQSPGFEARRDRFEARFEARRDRFEARMDRFEALRDRFEARMDQKYRILQQQADAATRQAEGEYQRNIAEANKIRDGAPNYTPVPKADVRQAQRQRTCTTTCSPCFYGGCVPSCSTVCD